MNLPMGTDPYEDLANAIVLLAAKDYRQALRRKGCNPLRRELERFFCSRWFDCLTKLDGKELMHKLQEERI